jgi:hypothetical protein
MAGTVTDIFIMALLVGGIGYGFLISRRVQRLMAMLQELEPAVREFSMAVDKSEESVSQMRQSLNEDVLTATAPEEGARAEAAGEPALAFSTRRTNGQRIPGVRIVKDKQDLVRQFFDMLSSERRA